MRVCVGVVGIVRKMLLRRTRVLCGIQKCTLVKLMFLLLLLFYITYTTCVPYVHLSKLCTHIICVPQFLDATTCVLILFSNFLINHTHL